MIDQLLIIAGAGIFGLLGITHLYMTFLTKNLHPFDEDVTEAMQSTSLRITKDTTVWKAWLGFNASHSIALLMLAAIYLPLVIWQMEVIRNSLWLTLLPVLVGFVFLMLAKKYWFIKPLIGAATATLCFMAAAISILL